MACASTCRKFFRATGLVLVLVAAGLVVTALHTAHEAGWLTFGQGADRRPTTLRSSVGCCARLGAGVAADRHARHPAPPGAHRGDRLARCTWSRSACTSRGRRAERCRADAIAALPGRSVPRPSSRLSVLALTAPTRRRREPQRGSGERVRALGVVVGDGRGRAHADCAVRRAPRNRSRDRPRMFALRNGGLDRHAGFVTDAVHRDVPGRAGRKVLPATHVAERDQRARRWPAAARRPAGRGCGELPVRYQDDRRRSRSGRCTRPAASSTCAGRETGERGRRRRGIGAVPLGRADRHGGLETSRRRRRAAAAARGPVRRRGRRSRARPATCRSRSCSRSRAWCWPARRSLALTGRRAEQAAPCAAPVTRIPHASLS